MKTIIFLLCSVTVFAQQAKPTRIESIDSLSKIKDKEIRKTSLIVTTFVKSELQTLQDALMKAQNDLNKQIIFFLQSNNIDQTQILGGLEYIDEKGKIKDKISFTLKPTNKTANLGK